MSGSKACGENNPKAQLQDLDNRKGSDLEENKIREERKYVDIYFKKLGLEQKCPRKEAEESCLYCTDKPTIFCAIFNKKSKNFFTSEQYYTIFKTMIEKEAEVDRELTLKRNTIYPNNEEFSDKSKNYLFYA